MFLAKYFGTNGINSRRTDVDARTSVETLIVKRLRTVFERIVARTHTAAYVYSFELRPSIASI